MACNEMYRLPQSTNRPVFISYITSQIYPDVYLLSKNIRKTVTGTDDDYIIIIIIIIVAVFNGTAEALDAQDDGYRDVYTFRIDQIFRVRTFSLFFFLSL